MNENDAYTWAKSHGREYVLRRGDGSEAGRVTIQGFCGTAARAAAADGRSWTFRRSGVFVPVVTVRREDDGAAPAAPLTFGSCAIALEDGRRYRWKSTSFFAGERAWTAEDGTPLLQFQSSSWLRGDQRIAVASPAVPPETAVLLALLGGFLKVLARDAASTAAIIAAVAGT